MHCNLLIRNCELGHRLSGELLVVLKFQSSVKEVSMKKSRFAFGAFCLFVLSAFAGVAMTQENGFDPVDVPVPNTDRFTGDPESDFVPPVELTRNPGGTFGDAPSPMSDQGLNGYFDLGSKRQSAPRVMRPRLRSRTVTESIMEVVPPEEVAEGVKLRAAIEALKNSQSDAEKKKAADIIQEQLKSQFERDLKQREKELATVEDRVRKLREQLDKRKAAQGDIINLRLQTLVNEANGLGFPASSFGGPTPNQFSPDSLDRGQFPSGRAYPQPSREGLFYGGDEAPVSREPPDDTPPGDFDDDFGGGASRGR